MIISKKEMKEENIKKRSTRSVRNLIVPGLPIFSLLGKAKSYDYRVRVVADQNGRYEIESVVPAPYLVPFLNHQVFLSFH